MYLPLVHRAQIIWGKQNIGSHRSIIFISNFKLGDNIFFPFLVWC